MKRKKRKAGLLISAILLVLGVMGWTVLVLNQAEKTEERIFNGSSYSLLIENVEPETVDYVSRLREIDYVWILSAPELVSDRDGFELDIRYLNSPNFVESDLQLANGAFPSNETEVALGLNFATNFYPDLSLGDELVLQNEDGEERTYTITGLFYEYDQSGMNAISIKNVQMTELGRLYALSSVENLGNLSREIQAETGQHVSHQSWQNYDEYGSLFDHTLLKNTFTILFISLGIILVGCCLKLKIVLDNVFNPNKQLYLTLGYSPKRTKRKEMYQGIFSSAAITIAGALLIYASFYWFGQTLGSALGIGLGGLMYQSTEYNPYIPFPLTFFFVFMLAVLLVVFVCFSVRQMSFFTMKKAVSYFYVGIVILASLLIAPLTEKMNTIWTDLTLRYDEQFGENGWDDEVFDQEGLTTFIEVTSVGADHIESFLKEARVEKHDFLTLYRNYNFSIRDEEGINIWDHYVVMVDEMEWNLLVETFDWNQDIPLSKMEQGDVLLLQSAQESGVQLENGDAVEVIGTNEYGEEQVMEQEAQIKATASTEQLDSYDSYMNNLFIVPKLHVDDWIEETDLSNSLYFDESVTLYAINHNASEIAGTLQDKLGDDYPFVNMYYDGFNNWFVEGKASLKGSATTFITVVISPLVLLLGYAFYQFTRSVLRDRKRNVQLALSTGLAVACGLISWFAAAQVVNDLTFPYLSLILFACLTGIAIAAVLIPQKESQELH